MSINKTFESEKQENIRRQGDDSDVLELAVEFIRKTAEYKYSYNFSWMGRPVIQFPQDMIAMQEIIWEVKPDLIIETGIAHGGSLVFYASLLELLCLSGYGDGQVIGVDIDIREHNRKAIEEHAMFRRIDMIEGSSISPEVISTIREKASAKQNIMVVLDSNHTHEHVLAELEAYAPLVTKGSYCVVFDTIIENMPEDFFPDRPWGKGDNPQTAVFEYLRKLENEAMLAADGADLNFQINREIDSKLAITVSPNGFLRRC